MAAYRWVDDVVTCSLTVCTPGSAPGPMLGNEYGKPLTFYSTLSCFDIGQCIRHGDTATGNVNILNFGVLVPTIPRD